MSIEQRLEDLTKAINELPDAIARVMGTTAQPQAEVTQEVGKEDVLKGEPVQSSGASEDSTKGGSDNESTGEIAGRKTYVFDKTTKTGQIVEKGETLPEGDNFVKVAKTNWEKLCSKHNLNPATGQALEEEADDDLGDLDDTEEEGEQEESGEDTDGDDLGLDSEEDEGGVDPAEVKKRMVRVMKEVGREDALKVLKKFGARNFDEINPGDLQGVYDLAGKLLEKAGN